MSGALPPSADSMRSQAVADGTSTFKRIGILRLSWPLLVVTLVTLLAVVADTVILSMGSAELNAAVATANQLLSVPYDLAVLFSIGALVVIAQLLGAGRLASARRATIIALRANTFLGLIIAAVLAVLGPWLVDLVHTPSDLVDDSLIFLYAVLGGVIFNSFIVVATAILRAYGRTVPILVIGILLNVVYLVLQYVFILVLDMGAAGAALSTTFARGGAVLVVAWVVWRRTGAHLFSKLPPREADTGAGRMAQLSIPTVLENGLYNVGILVVVSFINVLGTDAINARSYALTLTALVTGVVLALAQANETIVGWDAGGHQLAHAKRITLRTAAWAAGLSALFATFLWLGADAVLSIFGPSPEVLAGAREVLLLSIVLLPLSAVTAVAYGALRSTGDVVIPMVYSIASSTVILVPLAWLFVGIFGWGLAGSWWALILTEAVKSLLLLSRWLRGRWASHPSVIGDFDPEAEAEQSADRDSHSHTPGVSA